MPKKIIISIFMISALLLLTSCLEKKVDKKSEYYYFSWNKKNVYFKHIHTRGGFLPLPTGNVTKVELDADPKTFEVLNTIIAKDEKSVFCWSSKYEIADAPSFYQYSNKIYKDKNHVYLYGHNKNLNILADADPETYLLYIDLIEPNGSKSFLNESGLAKDKKGYLLNHQRINVDTATFHVLS